MLDRQKITFCISLPSLFKANRTLAASCKSHEMRTSIVVFIVGKILQGSVSVMPVLDLGTNLYQMLFICSRASLEHRDLRLGAHFQLVTWSRELKAEWKLRC